MTKLPAPRGIGPEGVSLWRRAHALAPTFHTVVLLAGWQLWARKCSHKGYGYRPFPRQAGDGTPSAFPGWPAINSGCPGGSRFVPQVSSDADPQVRRVGILAGCRVQSACAHGAYGTLEAMKPLARRPPGPASPRGLRGDTDRLVRRTRDTSTQGANPEERSVLRCGL